MRNDIQRIISTKIVQLFSGAGITTYHGLRKKNIAGNGGKKKKKIEY
jgi:hypothetical protein